jgi:hypothetical protein
MFNDIVEKIRPIFEHDALGKEMGRRLGDSYEMAELQLAASLHGRAICAKRITSTSAQHDFMTPCGKLFTRSIPFFPHQNVTSRTRGR